MTKNINVIHLPAKDARAPREHEDALVRSPQGVKHGHDDTRVQIRIPLDGDIAELLRRLKAAHDGLARALTIAQHGKRVQDDPEVIREQVRGVISATNRALNTHRGG